MEAAAKDSAAIRGAAGLKLWTDHPKHQAIIDGCDDARSPRASILRGDVMHMRCQNAVQVYEGIVTTENCGCRCMLLQSLTVGWLAADVDDFVRVAAANLG